MAPAHFKYEDFQHRKKFRVEFIGFDDSHTALKAMKITALHFKKCM